MAGKKALSHKKGRTAMNKELYEMLTLGRIRGFANRERLHFSKEDLQTIASWLLELENEVYGLRIHFRRLLREKKGENDAIRRDTSRTGEL